MSEKKRALTAEVAAAVAVVMTLPPSVRQKLLGLVADTPCASVLENAASNQTLESTFARYPQLSKQQRNAVQLASTRANVLITGPAGTGKSLLIAAIMDYMRRRFPGKVALLSYTGAAAVLVGGSTIHSYFGLRPPLLSVERSVAAMGRLIASRLEHTEHIVIDEVSMVPPDFF